MSFGDYDAIDHVYSGSKDNISFSIQIKIKWSVKVRKRETK